MQLWKFVWYLLITSIKPQGEIDGAEEPPVQTFPISSYPTC